MGWRERRPAVPRVCLQHHGGRVLTELARLRIAYDITITARTSTGVGVYARELLAALHARALDVQPWQLPLAVGGGVRRLANGARVARWLGADAHRRLTHEDIAVYHSTTSLGPLRRRKPGVITMHDAADESEPVRKGLACVRRGQRGGRRACTGAIRAGVSLCVLRGCALEAEESRQADRRHGQPVVCSS